MLWDVDYTLVGADGLGTRLYEVVFGEMFGRELTEVAPKAGRTDRAIVGDTLALAGSGARPRSTPFLAALARLAADGAVAGPVRPLPGAAAALASFGALASAGRAVGADRQPAPDRGGEAAPRSACLQHLDLDAGAYGWSHAVRANLVGIARDAARARYGRSFDGRRTVLVGDTPLDVEAALASGAGVVAVATGSYDVAALRRAGAHVVLPDLADTARVVAAVTGSRPEEAAGRVASPSLRRRCDRLRPAC